MWIKTKSHVEVKSKKRREIRVRELTEFMGRWER